MTVILALRTCSSSASRAAAAAASHPATTSLSGEIYRRLSTLVGDRRGALTGPGSCLPLSNRACGFPAHGPL